MSFLETGKDRLKWTKPVVQSAALPELGCVQCGRTLEATAGKPNLTGRCFSCSSFVTDDDEGFEELEY